MTKLRLGLGRVSRVRCKIYLVRLHFFLSRCLHKLTVNDIFTTRASIAGPAGSPLTPCSSFFSSSPVPSPSPALPPCRGPRQVREFAEVNMANKLLRRFLARRRCWCFMVQIFLGSIFLSLSPSPFLYSPNGKFNNETKYIEILRSNCFQFQRFASIFHV